MKITVDGARMREGPYVPVFQFPDKTSPQYQKWMNALPDKENIKPGPYNGVCIKHFRKTYLLNTEKRSKLRSESVPCIFDATEITFIDPEHR